MHSNDTEVVTACCWSLATSMGRDTLPLLRSAAGDILLHLDHHERRLPAAGLLSAMSRAGWRAAVAHEREIRRAISVDSVGWEEAEKARVTTPNGLGRRVTCLGGFAVVIRGKSDGQPALSREVEGLDWQGLLHTYGIYCALSHRGEHPNILPWMGLHVTDGGCAASIIYADHCQLTLRQAIRGAMHDSERIRILREIVEGLVFLHNGTPSLYHGDVSATNIVLDSHRQVRLAEVGLHTGDSPDVFLGPPSDVWQFGLLVVEVYGGHNQALPQGSSHDLIWIVRDSLDKDPRSRCTSLSLRTKFATILSRPIDRFAS